MKTYETVTQQVTVVDRVTADEKQRALGPGDRMKFSIRFGLLADKLRVQLKQQGLHLTNAKHWERRAQGLAELRVLGILTDTETRKAERRLMQQIQEDISIIVTSGASTEKTGRHSSAPRSEHDAS